MSEYDYTGNKVKNYFTAYLQKCIRWKRQNYIRKKENMNSMENPLEEELKIEYGMTVEEMVALHCKEELLLKECNGDYPEWNELSDKRLVDVLLLLRDEERRFIYQHVFQEKTFEEMGILNGIATEKIKGIYYYAIWKIRKWMGGEK